METKEKKTNIALTYAARKKNKIGQREKDKK